MSKLIDFVTKDKQEALSVKVRDPDPFDRSNLKKLQGFMLVCKRNFWVRPKAFCMENSKANYAMYTR